ncbi:hypothetical protein CDL12_02158 [Handroanthus impetiginosus]|uniref:LysM domain-containing protein n=1 Tax=Handroanthus impetiginosus TaxID=429701 RepID=A0A2G9I5U0_9LAMI|nr:hypothetical protein CDL12_02158 [Handroanthus impetiginosus]
MDDGNGEMDSVYRGMVGSSSPSRSPPVSSTTSAGVSVAPNGGANYILHTVSKFDTLAGVAIKYGVEVADIKRLNGLVTDLQMFALKTLQIPLPGRHPPSPSLCNGHDTPHRPSSSECNPTNRRHSDLFDSFQSLKLKSSSERKVSPAMNNLQGYYGLKQADGKAGIESFDMSLYRNGGAHYLEDGPYSTSSPHSNPPLGHHRKSKSVANGLMSVNGSLLDPLLSREGENGSSDKWIDKLLGRPKKCEADFTSSPPEKLLKDENSSSSAISAITGKGLALRPKSASRTVPAGVDGESGGPLPISLGDSFLTDNVNGVRKSSSTSSLQDSDNGPLSSIWPASKWSLRPDFQALSSAAIPIFDGLPKPVGRRNKAALD